MRVYMHISNLYKGFRELEPFTEKLTSVWSKTGEIFPMYDPETLEIFECGFNTKYGEICAFAEVTMAEFRKKSQGLKP